MGYVKKILVVDDDIGIRSSIVEFLEEDYDVESAESGHLALDMLKKNKYDLLLSDMQMAPMSGLDLVNKAVKVDPRMKCALLTGYKVDKYIDLIKQQKIANVITKKSPFDFDELSMVIENILYPETVFGLARYLNKKAKINKFEVRTSTDKTRIILKIIKYFSDYIKVATGTFDVHLILEELINNALFHGFWDEDGNEKYSIKNFDVLDPKDEVIVEFGKDNSQIGFSVSDNGGKLTLQKILETLERQINQKGLFDECGRGLYLSRALSSKMVVNIKNNELTEVIVLITNTQEPVEKPIHINVL